jgi:hypothetical protein
VGALAAVSIVVALVTPAAVAQPDCREWTECRQRALDAAERKEYETFHDLAWRAVQLGPKGDPALLFVLARAQSLSGRPHDALVMLRRLAPAGVARDAVASPEFERVRALQGWTEVEALLSASPEAREPEGPEARKTGSPEARGSRRAERRDAVEPPAGAEALTFAATSFKPAALAYDGVSRRFIISDTDVSRLAVIDEFSHQIATLASGHSAGFGTVTAIAIDPRAGDLWVASIDGSSGSDIPALHKLQLISGRVLAKFATAKATAGRFADVAVTPDGTVVAIQEGGQILRLSPRAARIEVVADVAGDTLSSVTVGPDGSIYVSGSRGVLRVSKGRATPMTAPAGADLSGLARIRWSRDSFVALQRAGDGGYRVIRARVGRTGRAVTAVNVLDSSVATPNPAAATLAGDAFYYLAATGGTELAIRRIIVK